MQKLFVIFFINLLLINLLCAQNSYEGKWKWYLIDNFETCYNWPIINGEYYKPEYYYRNPRLAIIRGGSKNLTETPKENCLGVKVLHMGYYFDAQVFIIPVRPIKLPGVCKKITFWINGRNKKLALKVMFANYLNYIYTLTPEPATLDFFGWKKLVIDDIDKKIPQLNPNRLDYRPLKIISFIIENKYRQVFYKPFYLYIDHLKAYCNEYTLHEYDGSEIPDKW